MAGVGKEHLRGAQEAVLRAEDMIVTFPTRGGLVHAVSGISLDVLPGETLGLVGESGCGKSSLGRALLQMPPPKSGKVQFDGQELTATRGRALRRLRARMQMIYQDPISSLNPRRTVSELVMDPMNIWSLGTREDRGRKVDEMLDSMGLDPARIGGRRPAELSGGQCQRISIARALVLDPTLLICDEPVSALDVSVQAQILNLLKDLRSERGLAMIFVSHDLAVVNNIADTVAVMYLGKLCEVGPPELLYSRPRHPYTAALLSAVPERQSNVEPPTPSLHRDVPSPINPPSGCRFRTRCPLAQDLCAVEEPSLRRDDDGRFVACHFPIQSTSQSVMIGAGDRA